MGKRLNRNPSTYRPELDGIRAFAVLAVMAYHGAGLWGPVYKGGFLGVDVFFVLSGFLITSLLVSEWDAKKDIRLRKFYARRAFRLFPALLVTVLVGGVVASLVTGPFPRPYLSSALMSLSYVANWFQAGKTLAPLGHTWSLSIEEQYYLVWPTVLLIALRFRRLNRQQLAGLVLLGALAMSLFRYVLYASGRPFLAELSTFSRPDGVLIGSALGLALSGETPRLRAVLARRELALASVAVVAIGTLVLTSNAHALFVGAWTLINVCTAFVIGHLTVYRGSVMQRWLSLPPLAAIGRISYGLYLFHLPLLWLFRDNPARRHGFVLYVCFFAATFAVATISYVAVESPFLRLKQRFEPDRRLPASGVAHP